MPAPIVRAHDNYDRARPELVARLAPHLPHRAGKGRDDVVLHLHRFEHEQQIAFLHRLAWPTAISTTRPGMGAAISPLEAAS